LSASLPLAAKAVGLVVQVLVLALALCDVALASVGRAAKLSWHASRKDHWDPDQIHQRCASRCNFYFKTLSPSLFPDFAQSA